MQAFQSQGSGKSSSDGRCDNHVAANTTTTPASSSTSISTSGNPSTSGDSSNATDAADDSSTNSSEQAEKSDSHYGVVSGQNDDGLKAKLAGGKCPYSKLASLDSKLPGPSSTMSVPSSSPGI